MHAAARLLLFGLPLAFGAACRPADGDGPSKDDPAPGDTGVDDSGTTTSGVRVLRTTHGVTHVRADNFWGLGLGVGRAWTQDNPCLAAWRIAEVRGALSAQLGPDAPVPLPVHGMVSSALRSDRYFRGWLDDDVIAAQFDAGAPEVVQLAAGYAEGLNLAFGELGTIPDCSVQVLAPVTRGDVYRIWVAAALVASGELLSPFLASAPPGASSAAALPAAPPRWPGAPGPFGSNVLAVGREGMAEGQGLLSYNPHFPWTGIHRLSMLHVEIPGELNVMGPALGGIPLPAAGFNAQVAWGLTFSNTARFTLAELQLDASDPMKYLVDGAPQAIEERRFDIEVAGEDNPRSVPFYTSAAGPILHAPTFRLGWSATTAFAVQDVNRDNTAFVEQLLALGRAADVDEVLAALQLHQGIPWSYVSAVDDRGEVLFAEVSRVPNVDDALLATCNGSRAADYLRSLGIIGLDGSQSACGWSGVMDPTVLPALRRADFVANSNNTHDLANPSAPLVGYPGVLGAEGTPLSLRPTLGLRMVDQRLDGSDGLGPAGYSAATAEAALLGSRGLAGELLAAAIAEDCLTAPVVLVSGEEVDLTAARGVLSTWDGSYRVDAVGALLFSGLWTILRENGLAEVIFAVPARWDAPVDGPSGYTADPEVRAAVRSALGRVVRALEGAGLAVDAPWGAGHCALSSTGCVGLPGSAGAEGAYDVLESDIGYGTFRGFEASLGGTPLENLFGVSAVHVVAFPAEGAGPEVRGLLVYGQATAPGSPWVEDQLRLHAAGAWVSLPFTEDQIQADPALLDQSPGR